MEAFKISIKLFVAKDDFGHAEFVPVFHRWIQEHVLDDHLLIDVADYAHVPAGPGSLLVTQEANLYMDRGGERLGLLYFRKTPISGSFADRVKQVLAATLKVASILELEPALAGRLKFRTDEISIRLNDRLLAPNTPETFTAVLPDLHKVAGELFGAGKATITKAGQNREVFEVKVSAASTSSVAELLSKISPLSV